MRENWSGIPGQQAIAQRLHMSKDFCDAFGHGSEGRTGPQQTQGYPVSWVGKLLAEDWKDALDDPKFSGIGQQYGLWSNRFAEFISGEASKLDAIVYEDEFGSWARHGLAKARSRTDLLEYDSVGFTGVAINGAESCLIVCIFDGGQGILYEHSPPSGVILPAIHIVERGLAS